MSYDLFMKPRAGSVDRERFDGYFKARPHYAIEGDQAWYRNEDTGVYFVFEFHGDASAPLFFNLNFFRPTYFAREAAPELQAFVHHFDVLVDDPQIDGMGTGDYSSERFLTGWATGNEAGYRALLRGDATAKCYSLPSAELNRIWRWNHERATRQGEIGESRFVPRIMFVDIDGSARTVAVWPDAVASLLPQTDYLYIARQELAPRHFLRKRPDALLVPWQQLEAMVRRHSQVGERPGFFLTYESPPADVAEYVKGLRSDAQTLNGISADSVLDAELVAKHKA